jgi:type III pantothenate kinase
MMLLLDLGNTRAKFALLADGRFVQRGALPWGPGFADELAALWRTWPQPHRVAAASVAGTDREAIVGDAVQAAFGHAVSWLRTPASACGVTSAYAEPQRLGVDRFLAMVDALEAGRAPCVLASVGTALTLDALTADGRHLGGLIAPGPQLMQQAVLGATAQVRPHGLGSIADVADNTSDALVSGCWQACAALIERFATRMAVPLGGSPLLTLGGGDGEYLAPLIAHELVLVPDTVLRGLAVWANAQSADIVQA